MMSPTGSFGGSRIRKRSMWANSAAMRPRLSQTPRRMVSISVADFSGKAAARFAWPIRCSRSRGPTARMKDAARSDMRLRSTARTARSADRQRSEQRVGSRFQRSRSAAGAHKDHARLAVAGSEADDDFSEYPPAFKPRQPAFELSKRDFGVDHRQEPGCHLGKALADVAH